MWLASTVTAASCSPRIRGVNGNGWRATTVTRTDEPGSRHARADGRHSTLISAGDNEWSRNVSRAVVFARTNAVSTDEEETKAWAADWLAADTPYDARCTSNTAIMM